MTTLKIAAISGSLRAKSYNTLALHQAQALLPEGVAMEMISIADVPLYNADLQAQGFPAPVEKLRSQIMAADGVLFASPEYNFSISGVLKNAIDWLSRMDPQPFKGKPIAIMSATTGPLGGARHQYELRKIMQSLDALVLVKPEIFIGMSAQRFGPEGNIVDENTLKLMTTQMAAFKDWMLRLRAPAR